MSTIPSFVKYNINSYSYTVSPNVIFTRYHSNNSRQRKMMKKRDDIFSVSCKVSTSELLQLETFFTETISNAEDVFTVPYFVSDAEFTGSAYLMDGNYSVKYISPNVHDVSFSLELKDRSMDAEENIYNLVNEYSGFDGLYDIMQATEDAVNYNNL